MEGRTLLTRAVLSVARPVCLQDTMTYNPSSLGTASNPYIGRWER